ncbi:MAG: hypothetical protein WBA93_04480 [Microcoleaceae cyanobacterium]
MSDLNFIRTVILLFEDLNSQQLYSYVALQYSTFQASTPPRLLCGVRGSVQIIVKLETEEKRFMKQFSQFMIVFFVSLAMVSLPSKILAAMIHGGREAKLFGDATGFDVQANWFWGAHEGGTDQDQGKISANNPRVELQSSFAPDDHGSTAAGNVVYEKVGDVVEQNGIRLINVSAKASAFVNPVCPDPPPNSPKCGPISLLDISKN